MAKAVLVMDMPESCIECPFHIKGEEIPLGNWNFHKTFECQIKRIKGLDYYISDIQNKSPDCPLVEPEKYKKEPIDLQISPLGVKTSSGYKKGWNDCLKEIGII